MEDLFGFIDSAELTEEEWCPFGDPVNPLFDRYRNQADMPIDIHIGLTLLGERSREQFFERMRLMRIKHRVD
jgi:hypothetical protein